MDNVTMAHLFSETADLMEIDGADSFRVRSYRSAADAIGQTTVDLVVASSDTAQLLAIPGIGKSMAANIQAMSPPARCPCVMNSSPSTALDCSIYSNFPVWVPKPSRCCGMQQDREHRPACRSH